MNSRAEHQVCHGVGSAFTQVWNVRLGMARIHQSQQIGRLRMITIRQERDSQPPIARNCTLNVRMWSMSFSGPVAMEYARVGNDVMEVSYRMPVGDIAVALGNQGEPMPEAEFSAALSNCAGSRQCDVDFMDAEQYWHLICGSS